MAGLIRNDHLLAAHARNGDGVIRNLGLYRCLALQSTNLLLPLITNIKRLGIAVADLPFLHIKKLGRCDQLAQLAIAVITQIEFG